MIINTFWEVPKRRCYTWIRPTDNKKKSIRLYINKCSQFTTENSLPQITVTLKVEWLTLNKERRANTDGIVTQGSE